MQPHFAEALLNRGVSLQELRRFDEAFASYDRALALQPDYAEVHFNEAICRLLLGDFDRGWKSTNGDGKLSSEAPAKRSFTQPLWLGREEIAGKTILLHAEQGFGDTIQFCRYVPLVAERGARVILEVQEPLRELMAALADTTQVISMGSLLPEFDMQCPLLSLPLAFRTRLETIPSKVPLPARVIAELWRIGTRGSGQNTARGSALPGLGDRRTRTIAIDRFSFNALLSLLDIDATFVSVQKDVRARGRDCSARKKRHRYISVTKSKTFSDTAALVSNSGSRYRSRYQCRPPRRCAGKAGLGYAPFHRRTGAGCSIAGDSPWYPTARLFRQDDTRAWDNVIAQVCAALRDFLEPRRELHLATAE